MSNYKKILGGNGAHGTKYEINLLLYHLLKAYVSEEDFEMFHGEKVKETLDDIVLKTETSRIYVQSKHCEKSAKTLTDQHFFGAKGDYSLCVYLNVAYNKIFHEFFVGVQNHLVELEKTNRKDDAILEDLKNTTTLLINTNTSQINNFQEDTFKNFISNLRKLNNHKINELLLICDTFIHLVTNRIPNEKLTDFSIDSKTVRNFNNIEKYSFNTDESIQKLFNQKH